MDNLELYLTTRIKALDAVIRMMPMAASDTAKVERAICIHQLELVKQHYAKTRSKSNEFDTI